MVGWTARSTVVASLLLLAGCRLVFDPSAYDGQDGNVGGSDGGASDAGMDASDAPSLDAPSLDAPSLDAAVIDAAVFDVGASLDAPALDSPSLDAPAPDIDAPAPLDAFETLDAQTAPDASEPDAPLDAHVGPDARCTPGARVCTGDRSLDVCDPTGSSWVPDTCGPSEHCYLDGVCLSRASCASPASAGCDVVYVPGGEYDFGEVGERFAAPARRVRVSAFYVDAHEVTVERFRRWLAEAGDPPSLPTSVTYPNGTSVTLVPSSYAAPIAMSTFHGSDPLLPVTGVRPSTAQGFCAWDGGRLPTEAEWEWLAAGRPVAGLGSERHFPWGSAAPSCSLANSMGCGGMARAVTSSSPVGGVYDLSGNVFEWTVDAFEDLALFGGGDAAVADAGVGCWPMGATLADPVCQNAAGNVTRRGGSHATPAGELGNAYRYYYSVFMADLHTGFRCVYPVP